MSLTANQRRFLIKLINQAENAERAFVRRRPERLWEGRIKARRKFMNSRMRLYGWAMERGLDPLTINRQAFALNSIANVLKKTKLAERIKYRAWGKGLEAEKKRALNNLKQFNKNFKYENGKWTVTHQPSPKRKTPSPKRKTPSPPRARTPGANEAFARWHTLAPPTNAPVTWSRNQNSKVIRYKTFTEVARGITPTQRKAMASMAANQKQNFVKSLARRPKVR